MSGTRPHPGGCGAADASFSVQSGQDVDLDQRLLRCSSAPTFAGGGLVVALITPVLILITGALVPLGVLHLHYGTIAAFAHHPTGKLIFFGAVALPAWHAAHRLRMTAYDLGLGGGVVVKAACYGTAWLLILVAAGALIAI